MADLGQATLELKTDNSDFDKGLGNAEGSVKKFGLAAKVAITAIGAVVTAGLKGSVDTFTDLGDTIHKMSLRTGASTEFLSEFAHVLEQGGSSIQDFSGGIRKLNEFIAKDFAEGTTRADQILGLLNMTSEEFGEITKLTVDERLPFLIKALRDVEDETEQYAAAQRLLGGAGVMLLPIVRDTQEAFEETMQEARDLGKTMSQETADAAANLADAMHELEGAQTSLAVETAFLISPVLTDLNRMLSRVVGGVVGFMRENETLAKVVVYSTAVIGGLTLALGVISLSFGVWAKAIGVAKIAFLALNTAMLANPIGLVATAIAALVVIIGSVRLATGSWTETFLVLGEAIVNYAITPINLLLKTLDFLGRGLGKINEDWGFTIDTIEVKFPRAIETATEATEQFTKSFEYTVDKYTGGLQEMMDMQMNFSHNRVMQTKKEEEAVTEEMVKGTEERLMQVNEKFKSITGENLFKALGADAIKQSKAIADAGTSVSSGERQLMADLAAGGTLQVSTGERDERGGVIFRDATAQEQRDMFSHRIGGPPPSLLGMPTFNAPAERDFVNNRGNLANMGGEQTTFNISLSDKMIDQAVGQRFAQEGLGGE